MAIVSRLRLSLLRGYAVQFSCPQRHLRTKAKALPDCDGKLIRVPEPQLNIDRYCDPTLTEYFVKNVADRKGVGSIHRVIELNNALKLQKNEELRRELIQEALKIPNETHPEPAEYGHDGKVLKTMGRMPEYNFEPKSFDQLLDTSDQFRMKELSPMAGHRAYYLIRELAELEQALIRLVVQKLIQNGFSLISVPDILHHQIIECCGVPTRGQRSLVYRLDGEKHLASAADGELCLSGTAEMALGGFLMNKSIKVEDLPQKYVAVSRCYRAETADIAAERGLYRVHQFTKVEMFGVTSPIQSGEQLEEFLAIQEDIFSLFGLHLQVLDMPPRELGAPAYRKYDIEAWLPSRKFFGEVSSCSNCTDYQSRRLNIKCTSENTSKTDFAHTVNGTACAIPRLIMAICETHQQEDGSIRIPKVLQPYMSNKDKIKPMSCPTKFVKRGALLLKQLGVEE